MPTSPSPCLRLRGGTGADGLRRVVASALLGTVMASAVAAPDELADPVLRFMAERHLIEAPLAPSIDPDAGVLRRFRERAAEMVLVALNSVGVRYQRGGTSESSGFDCSGFTRYVVGLTLGITLPRSADEQANAAGLVAVKREDLQPGDLVFFNTLRRTFSHVGIYIGGNRFVHAPSAGGEIRTEDMGFAYWKKRFTGARRAEALSNSASVVTKALTAATALPVLGDSDAAAALR